MILLIDTAQETSTIALADKDQVLFVEENPVTNESASWLHPALSRLLKQADRNMRQIEAVAVVEGPGSYTGLRVGMAAAKGFCYALKIPLITQNTLKLMAVSMQSRALELRAWICPMIDARRQEVYTGLYQSDGQELSAPRALILDKNAFEMELSQSRIIFFGSGAEKWRKITPASSALFEAQPNSIQYFAKLAANDFQHRKWADPILAEPVYLKEFFSY